MIAGKRHFHHVPRNHLAILNNRNLFDSSNSKDAGIRFAMQDASNGFQPPDARHAEVHDGDVRIGLVVGLYRRLAKARCISRQQGGT